MQKASVSILQTQLTDFRQRRCKNCRMVVEFFLCYSDHDHLANALQNGLKMGMVSQIKVLLYEVFYPLFRHLPICLIKPVTVIFKPSASVGFNSNLTKKGGIN